MKKRLLSITALVLMLGVCLLPAFTTAHAEESAPTSLSFGSDGTFTVLILSDLQDTQFTTKLVVSGETHALKDYPADLIVLLGDQLEGPSPVLRLGSGAKNCEDTLRTLLAPVAESGIPFVVVFGNHDYEAPLSIAEQVKIYESYDNCIAVSFGKDSTKDGAFVLPIKLYNSDVVDMALYFFDSGSYIANGDYDTVSKEQVAWYNEQSAAFKAANDGQALPSAAFCHIPLPEVYNLLTEVPKGTKGAFKGVGVGAGKYYLPNEDKIFTGAVNEAPCPSSENNGLFDAYLANGDVFLTVNGHDHVNSFIGSVEGIDIASAPGSSYTSYGDEDVRGVRLFRFTEFNVRDYETLHVLYSDYNTPASFGYLRYYFSTTTGIYNAIKVVLSILIVIVAIVVTIIVVTVRKKRRKAAAAVLPAEAKDETAVEAGKNE
jgi:hypothetical protein